MAVLVISYTRVHQPQVRQLVALLRASIPKVEEAVFWDEDFEPGQKWIDQFNAAIDRSPKLFVFWCGHAAGSPQVTHEYRYALERGKVVIPVLFDNAPLHPELAEIQGIDLRQLIKHLPPGAWEVDSTSARVGPVDLEALVAEVKPLLRERPDEDVSDALVVQTIIETANSMFGMPPPYWIRAIAVSEALEKFEAHLDR